jgi:hypothetical protein
MEPSWGRSGAAARVGKLVSRICCRAWRSCRWIEALGRRAGLLLGRAHTSDVVNAAVVLVAADGDSVLTSDPDDIGHLADVAGLDVDVLPV